MDRGSTTNLGDPFAPITELLEQRASEVTRLREAINTVWLNALRCKPEDHADLMDFLVNGLRGVLDGQTLGDAVVSWQKSQPDHLNPTAGDR